MESRLKWQRVSQAIDQARGRAAEKERKADTQPVGE
jgi:hypothetical protein